jgi:predicted GIY-YIG superfamily endonuclease
MFWRFFAKAQNDVIFLMGQPWYGCTQLVYYEFYADMIAAIAREKQIKAGSRKKKLALIESLNPRWLDLFDTLF